MYVAIATQTSFYIIYFSNLHMYVCSYMVTDNFSFNDQVYLQEPTPRPKQEVVYARTGHRYGT